MEALIHHFKLVTEGFRRARGRGLPPVEAPAASWAATWSADGAQALPGARARPRFVNLQALPP